MNTPLDEVPRTRVLTLGYYDGPLSYVVELEGGRYALVFTEHALGWTNGIKEPFHSTQLWIEVAPEHIGNGANPTFQAILERSPRVHSVTHKREGLAPRTVESRQEFTLDDLLGMPHKLPTFDCTFFENLYDAQGAIDWAAWCGDPTDTEVW